MHISEIVRGRILMLSSAFCFGLMALFTRIAANIPSIEKVFFRSFFGLILIGVIIGTARIKIGRPRNVTGLLLRGIFGSLALLCYFFAIDRCGLPKATLYCYTYPLWATCLAWVELGEKPSRRALWALCLAIAGVILTLDVGQIAGTGLAVADLVGLSAGVLTGAAIVSVRKLRKNESSWWIVIFFTGTGVLFSLPSTALFFSPPTLVEWGLLWLIALMALVAQLLMTKAYRYVSASEGSMLSLTVVPWSTLFSIVFLGEVPSLRFYFGAAIVFGAVLVLSLEATKRTQHPDPETVSLID